MALPIVHVEAKSVTSRLREIGGGIPAEVLRKAVELGYAKRKSCTKNDAAGYPGMTQFSGTLRSVREDLIPRGWYARRDHGLELVVSPDMATAITIGSGNVLTGSREPYAVPSSRYPRGAATIIAVLNNNNGQTLFPFEDRVLTAGQHGIRRETWILLLYLSPTEVRYELSRPKSISHDGYKIIDWHERLTFDPIARDIATIKPLLQAEDEANIDVPVKRRAQ